MTSSSLREYVDDITQCPICLEVYDKPRMLPCVHTFCLKCISLYCRERTPGDGSECPVCRTQFVVPPGGVESLPLNFVVDGFVSIRKSKQRTYEAEHGQRVACEVCAEEGSDACAYCTECRQKLCADCWKVHSKQRLPGGSHRIVKLHAGKTITPDSNENQHSRSQNCEQHRENPVNIYCMNCRVELCHQCAAASDNPHRQHRCVDIRSVAEEFRRQIQTDVDEMTRRLVEIEKRRENLVAARDQLALQVREAKSAVEERAEEVNKLMKTEVAKMLERLDEETVPPMKQIETLVDNCEFSITALKAFLNYAQEANDSSGPSGIIRIVGELKTRAGVLSRVAVCGTEAYCADPKVCFKAADDRCVERMLSTVGGWTAMLGELSVNLTSTSSGPTHIEPSVSDYVEQPPLLSSFATDGYVWGVTQLDDIIYVVCRPSDTIQKFSGIDFRPLGGIRLKGLRQPRDIVACSDITRAIFVADCKSRDQSDAGCVWRVLPDVGQIDKWLPNATSGSASMFCPRALSVTSRRLLVTSRDQLHLYGIADGVELSRIPVTGLCPEHAVESGSGTFLVCHWKPVCQVSEIDVSGKVIRSYSGEQQQQQLKDPYYMCIDSSGRVLVADGNHRIVQLSASLQLERILLDSRHNGLVRDPWRACLVEKSGRLLVGGERGTSSSKGLFFGNVIAGCVQIFNVLGAADQRHTTE